MPPRLLLFLCKHKKQQFVPLRRKRIVKKAKDRRNMRSVVVRFEKTNGLSKPRLSNFPISWPAYVYDDGSSSFCQIRAFNSSAGMASKDATYRSSLQKYSAFAG